MVTESGLVKVLDFGLARGGASDNPAEQVTLMTQAGMVLGTAPYMSPEQVEARPVDPRSDIFSLGIVMYEMATGSRPFKGDTPASLMLSILKDHPRAISEIRRDVPEGVAQLIGRCLEKNPRDRVQSTQEILIELKAHRRAWESGVSSKPRTSSAEDAGVGREPFPHRRAAVSVAHGRQRRGSAGRWPDRRHHCRPGALSLSARRLAARRRGGQGKSRGRPGGSVGWRAVSARRRRADGGHRDARQCAPDRCRNGKSSLGGNLRSAADDSKRLRCAGRPHESHRGDCRGLGGCPCTLDGGEYPRPGLLDESVARRARAALFRIPARPFDATNMRLSERRSNRGSRRSRRTPSRGRAWRASTSTNTRSTSNPAP